MKLKRKKYIPENVNTKFVKQIAREPHLKERKITYLVIFFLAFLIRLLFFIQSNATPLVSIEVSGLDPYLYNQLAHSLLSGDFFNPQLLWTMPLYPYVLAIFYKVIGTGLFGVCLLQVLTGSLNCVLICVIGERLFNRRVGLIAGILACGYGLFIFHEMILVSFFLQSFLALGAILLLLHYFEHPSNVKLISSGAICGLLMMVSAGSAFFVLSILFILIAGKRAIPIKNWREPIIFSLVVCAALLPFTLRNYLISDEFIPFSAHGGINFYIGNNPHASGSYQPLSMQHAGYSILNASAKAQAEQLVGRKLSAKEVSDFWFRRAFNFIGKNPLVYLRLMVLKIKLFLSPTESYDVLDCDFLQRHFIKFNIPLFNFWLVFPLGLIGIFLSYGRHRHLKVLYFFMAGIFLSNVLFFVNARYRLEIMSLIIIFAGFSVDSLISEFQKKSCQKIITILSAFFVLAGVLSLLRISPPKESISYRNVGNYYFRSGNYDEALKSFQKALLIDPAYGNAYFGLGNVYRKKSLHGKAIFCYKKAIALDPNNFQAYNNLGSIYTGRNELDQALIVFQKANRINPNYPLIHCNIAMILRRMGRLDEARVEYQQALNLEGNFQLALDGLKALEEDLATRQ